MRDDQIVDYTDGEFIAQAMQRNGGGFDAALDLVGGSIDAREADARDKVLRDLAKVVRRARVAAYNGT